MEFKVRNMLIMDGDLKKEFKIGEDTFIIIPQVPNARRTIEEQIARWLNGVPVSAYSQNGLSELRVNATVDVCTVSGPDWWKGSMECVDNETVIQLYQAIQEWDTEFQEALKKNRFVKGSPGPKVPS